MKMIDVVISTSHCGVPRDETRKQTPCSRALHQLHASTSAPPRRRLVEGSYKCIMRNPLPLCSHSDYT